MILEVAVVVLLVDRRAVAFVDRTIVVDFDRNRLGFVIFEVPPTNEIAT